ncbi:MAG: Asp23/Gls24 family envelope stress response protein [Lachnospirales bacterium]
MAILVKNKYGTINITKKAIVKIAGITAMECYGIVGMAARSFSDGFFKLLKQEKLDRGINIHESDNKIDITLHIIVLYGTNIPVISRTLQDSIKYRIKEYTGIEVNNINIYVEGLKIDI